MTSADLFLYLDLDPACVVFFFFEPLVSQLFQWKVEILSRVSGHLHVSNIPKEASKSLFSRHVH